MKHIIILEINIFAHRWNVQPKHHHIIIDIVKDAIRITKCLLEEIPPDSTEVKFITYANLLSVLCFNVHPNLRHDTQMKHFLKLD